MESGKNQSESDTGSRLVRVGTHALKPGSGTTLWNRLSQHKEQLRSRGRNHRGSIFRFIVGTALIDRDGIECSSWDNRRSTAPPEVRQREQPFELTVSDIIGGNALSLARDRQRARTGQPAGRTLGQTEVLSDRSSGIQRGSGRQPPRVATSLAALQAPDLRDAGRAVRPRSPLCSLSRLGTDPRLLPDAKIRHHLQQRPEGDVSLLGSLTSCRSRQLGWLLREQTQSQAHSRARCASQAQSHVGLQSSRCPVAAPTASHGEKDA